ncbi:MAG: ABC transporter permease [Anaerolineaceae bacterium]|nr:ABC transporter permease [Anaerolineaceae bacterium]
MNKIWLVAKYEFLRHVLRKRFLLILLGLPLFIVFMMAMGVAIGLLSMEQYKIGLVDKGGYLSEQVSAYIADGKNDELFSETELIFATREDQVADLLEAEEINAYYIIPEGYPEQGVIHLISNGEPDHNVLTVLDDMMNERSLANVATDLRSRILYDPEITVQSIETDRQQSSNEWYVIFVPIISGILFMVVINTSGGYLLRAVVEEKENRTMEIMLTSVSSNQLMTGKIYGNLSVGLVQMLFWFGLPLLAYIFVGPAILENFNARIDPQFFYLSLLTLIPAFILVAAMMAALGATVTETQEAQQVSGLFTLPIVAPYWFMALLIENPNSAFSVGLSLFPLTAPVTLPLRAVFTDIPIWQSALSITLLVVSAYVAVRLTGSIFRLGMLRYGKRLSFKEIFRGLRGREA